MNVIVNDVDQTAWVGQSVRLPKFCARSRSHGCRHRRAPVGVAPGFFRLLPPAEPIKLSTSRPASRDARGRPRTNRLWGIGGRRFALCHSASAGSATRRARISLRLTLTLPTSVTAGPSAVSSTSPRVGTSLLWPSVRTIISAGRAGGDQTQLAVKHRLIFSGAIARRMGNHPTQSRR